MNVTGTAVRESRPAVGFSGTLEVLDLAVSPKPVNGSEDRWSRVQREAGGTGEEGCATAVWRASAGPAHS